MDIVPVSHPGQVSPAVPTTPSLNGPAANRELIQAVKGINASQVLGADAELTLTIDQQTRRPVIRVISRQTNEVVMQLPAEYILQLEQALQSRPDTYQKSDISEGSDQASGYSSASLLP